MRSRAARTRLAPSSRLPFTVAAAHQAHLDASLAAIAAKDARKLADTLVIITENKVAAPAELLWRAAGGQADADIMAVLYDAHRTQTRTIGNLCHSAWQGAVIANNVAVMSWLSSCDEAMLNYEEKAALAGLAVREGYSVLARELITPVRNLGPQLADKKTKLLVNYLHACSANNRAELALEILDAHFSPSDGVFSPHNSAFQNIVMRATVEGHARTLQAMLDHGADYLSDDHIGQLLVAALDKNNVECARIAQRFGGDPLSFDNAAIRHAVRHLATALNAQDVNANARADEIDRRMVIVETLLAGGANPFVARQAVAQWVKSECAPEALARIDACADGLQARHTARLLPPAALSIEDGMMPRVYRDPHLVTVNGRYEGIFHQAARHRVLDVMMRRGFLPLNDAALWEAKNPAGTRLIDLAAASGQLAVMLSPDLWAGKVGALRTMLSCVDGKDLSEEDRGALLHKAQLETLKMQRSENKGRFKL